MWKELVIWGICILKTVGFSIALFCLIGDVINQNRKKIVLQGHRSSAPYLIYCWVFSKSAN